MIDHVIIRPFVESYHFTVEVRIYLGIQINSQLYWEVKRNPHRAIAVGVWGEYGLVTDNSAKYGYDTETDSEYETLCIEVPHWNGCDDQLIYNVKVKSLLPGKAYVVFIDTGSLKDFIQGPHQVVVKFR